MTTVHQVLAKLAEADAIGHEVLGIQRRLLQAGYRSDIFVEMVDPQLEDITRDYHELYDEPDAGALLIHHFSIGSNASRTAFALPHRMALIYHNVTPPEYFVDFSPDIARHCYLGRRELRAYAHRCVIALADSEFNRRDLDLEGFPRTAVLPVIPDFTHLAAAPDPVLLEMFDDGWTNIVFVGRMAPNKKIEDVIRFFHVYQTHFNSRSRLLLVGSHEGLDRYVFALTELLERLGQKHVEFLGRVSNSELVACYESADLFLCASEHEGFCVPIVEAFYKEVPVMAYAAAAVPSTMDGAGMLYHAKDPMLIAALMNDVLSDGSRQEDIIQEQLAAVDRLQSTDFNRLLLTFVEDALSPAAAR